VSETALHCPRTSITHERGSNDKPLCDPQGLRADIYITAALHVTCAACRHIRQPNHRESA